MKPVYITGSSVITTLTDPGNIHSGQISQISLDILGKSEDFPYFCIANPDISTGAERMFHITHDVVTKAINESGLTAEELQHTALFVGSTSYSIPLTEQNYVNELKVDPNASPIGLSIYEELTNYIREQFMPMANSFSLHTACTSSANALIYASKMIGTGKIRHALIVGLEFFNKTTLFGFHALNLISKSRIQPFGTDRDGIILGEGCSAVVLSCTKPQSSHPITILGGATSVDTDSMTTVKSDGTSIASVIHDALVQTNTKPEEISAIKLHGTASQSNDNAESAGIKLIFDKRLPPVIALKPSIGHTLGACGTNEISILRHYLQKNLLPGLPYSYPMDPELNIHLQTSDIPIKPGKFLLNHFGFGGNNTALIVSNVEP